MKNMSFMLTTAQFRNRSKTVTRRLGWSRLKPGDLVMGVEKGMGLKPGEQIVRLGAIRILDVRGEPLRRMTDNIDYGFDECAKEGFGKHPRLCWPSAFVEFFCNSHKGCTPETEINRIAFEYVDAQPKE
ncbi:MAG: hypothetical protein EPN60_15130 [Nevskiaceae bacterium]|nr:MAG: hypothetical protein EPN60_15130 [Nevskiaceae bacterium]